VVASTWRFLRTKSSACFTADRSSGEVAVVAAVANGALVRGGAVFISTCASIAEGPFVGDDAAETASGARDNGPRWDRAPCRASELVTMDLAGLALRSAGRSRGSGTVRPVARLGWLLS
jgi:hypothetical protein